MPSIINGLFSARSGISSHGSAIAVVGDNIANSSTIGFKTARAEFEDLVAGGQASGTIIGSGSSLSGVNTVNSQGTLEFTNRALDLAIDGNGYFAVAQGNQRFYTRAGNFKVNESGYIVNQNGQAVLGFPDGGSGALEPLNVNTISQTGVATTTVSISGNLNAAAAPITNAQLAIFSSVPPVGTASTSTATSFATLNNIAEYSNTFQVFDALGQKHELTTFFVKDPAVANQFRAFTYARSEQVESGGTPVGYPRLVGSGVTMTFSGTGARTNAPATGSQDLSVSIAWNNGAAAAPVKISFAPYTQFSASSSVLAVNQDGKGIGTVTSISIASNGTISALLDNGQSAEIGKFGLVNFSNAEGLTRVGGQLLQQSNDSGEPVVGTAKSGTFGAIQSGSVELSTVDIASEFVKLITLQRGFQANSRIITTVNSLLNDIIQLV